MDDESKYLAYNAFQDYCQMFIRLENYAKELKMPKNEVLDMKQHQDKICDLFKMYMDVK